MRQSVSTSAEVEYMIYTFDPPSDGQRGQNRWHRYAALGDEDLALAQAQILSDTKKYHRIEVKKKYFDAKKGRAMDATLCVYESGVERRRANMIGFVAGIAVMAVCVMTLASLF